MESDSGSSLPLDGEGGTVSVIDVRKGGVLEASVNLDFFDPSEGAEGIVKACYCEGLSDFTMPMAPPSADSGPPADAGPPDEGPPADEGPPPDEGPPEG